MTFYKYSRLFVILLLAFTGCQTVKYTSPQFNAKARDHKIIAVLPVEMVYTGKLPRNLTESQKIELENAESLIFQQTFYNALLRRSGNKKKDIKIEIQSVERTNRLLKEKGIDLRDAHDMHPEELAKVLGVSAVVKYKVEKNRYLSDLASYGIDLAKDILDILFPEISGVIPDGLSKTFDIKVDAQLLNGEDGSVLWKNFSEVETDWDTKPKETIEQLGRLFARNFPYTNKYYL